MRHGHSRTRTYKRWIMMIQRCCNPKSAQYPSSGGRGITVCDRWKNSFPAFLEDMGEAPPGSMLSRKNYDLGYDKDNSYWATSLEHYRASHKHLLMVEFRGETKYLTDWCRLLNLPYHTAYMRIKRLGWTVEESFSRPLKKEYNYDQISIFRY